MRRPAFRAASSTCTIFGTQPFASATGFRRSHTLPPSEMKSLYGSITRSAVARFSYASSIMAASPLLIRVEDIVLRLHDRMARVSTVNDTVLVRRKRIGRGVVVERHVSPSAGGRKTLAVLLDEEEVLQAGGHIHVKRGLRALLEPVFDFRDLGSIRERVAIPRNAGPVCVDHRGICHHDLQQFRGLTDRHNLPALVSPEICECEALRVLHRGFVLGRNSDTGEDGQYQRAARDGREMLFSQRGRDQVAEHDGTSPFVPHETQRWMPLPWTCASVLERICQRPRTRGEMSGYPDRCGHQGGHAGLMGRQIPGCNPYRTIAVFAVTIV